MMTFRARMSCACLLVWAMAIAPALHAQSGPVAPLSLRQAVEAALRGNPDLKSFEFLLRAQQARAEQAGLRPSPALSFEIEDALGTGEAQGLDAAEATFALSQIVELGGKRLRRMEAARLGNDAILVERQAAQLDVLAEVARRYIHVASDQKQLEVTRKGVDLSKGTVEAVQRRVDAAKSPEVELHRANVALMRAEIDLRHAEHEIDASRRKLAAMWGEGEARFGQLDADLYAMPRPLTFESLVARLAGNPDFTRFASEARLRDAEIRLAEAQRRSDIELTAGVRRLQESKDEAFVLGFSVPLFAGKQAAPAIAEARAMRGQVDAEREAAFVKARAQVYELYVELDHAIGEVTTLKNDVLPQMEEALQETQYAYDRGRYSYLELVDGQREYLDAQRALIEAATNAQLFQVEIERLSGEPLAASE